MDSFQFQSLVKADLMAGRVDAVITALKSVLKKIPVTPFHQVLELEFTDNSQTIADSIDRFVDREAKRFDFQALYLETNGFAWNTDSWWFSSFGYRSYGGHLNYYDWLSRWDSTEEEADLVVLHGMEALQETYRKCHEDENIMEPILENPETKFVEDFCSLLVICQFQKLIGKAVPLTKLVNFPLLATSHDYDFIAEFRRGSETG